MSKDSETIDTSAIGEKSNDDFPSIGMELFKKINVKVAVLLFVASIIIFSDYFVANAMPKKFINDGNMPDTKGTLLQLVLLTFSYIILDLLVQGKVL